MYLREPTIDDRDPIVGLSRASQRLHQGWVSAPITAQKFQSWLERSKQADARTLLVCRVEDEAIVGVFTFSQIFRRSFQNAYLGYYAFEPHARRGYMSEGMDLALRHAFASLKLHRVEANVQPENAASIALVKRAGFRLEGFSPRYLKIAGRWRDHQRWAMLIDDWRRLRQRRRAVFRRPVPQAPLASSSPGRPRSG